MAKRLALLLVVVVASGSFFTSASADEGSGYTAFDISWPQCPNDFPEERFEFAIIGLNNGKPFTANPCFAAQYRWAQAAEPHPDIYINVDFPRAGRREALSGPMGRCAEEDNWCRGYNWGYALARDTVARVRAAGITPERIWLDVETDNHWTDVGYDNAQVVRAALDYFLDFNVPIGIYSTYYQWGLITGDFMPPAKLPLWVAGATSAEMAKERCTQPRFAFAGGVIWLVQYVVGKYDHNHACVAREQIQNVREEGRAATESKTPAPTNPQTPKQETTSPVQDSNAETQQRAKGSAFAGVFSSLRESWLAAGGK